VKGAYKTLEEQKALQAKQDAARKETAKKVADAQRALKEARAEAEKTREKSVEKSTDGEDTKGKAKAGSEDAGIAKKLREEKVKAHALYKRNQKLQEELERVKRGEPLRSARSQSPKAERSASPKAKAAPKAKPAPKAGSAKPKSKANPKAKAKAKPKAKADKAEAESESEDGSAAATPPRRPSFTGDTASSEQKKRGSGVIEPPSV